MLLTPPPNSRGGGGVLYTLGKLDINPYAADTSTKFSGGGGGGVLYTLGKLDINTCSAAFITTIFGLELWRQFSFKWQLPRHLLG